MEEANLKPPRVEPDERPLTRAEVTELAQRHARRSIEALAFLADEQNKKKEHLRLAAATELLNRGYGRPGPVKIADEIRRVARVIFNVGRRKRPGSDA